MDVMTVGKEGWTLNRPEGLQGSKHLLRTPEMFAVQLDQLRPSEAHLPSLNTCSSTWVCPGTHPLINPTGQKEKMEAGSPRPEEPQRSSSHKETS